MADPKWEASFFLSMIQKSVKRFSEKIMLNQRIKAR